MALRLANAKTPAPAPVAARPERAIADRALAALRDRDLDRLVALARDTAEIADPHRRYVARRALVEIVVHASTGATGADAARLLLAAARTALDVLAPAPAEPVLLNAAGVALYELGALRGAEALFKAAGRLDPELPHVDANLREIARRRRGGVRVDLPPAIALALPDVTRRAVALAGAARPADRARISLCMIVRDEEEVLARCLTSARPAVDEMIVVDTGSTDRTRDIARELGATVLEHAWTDDFAEARNVGVDAATGDWILFLDADEVLVGEDVPRLRELARRTWREGFLLTITNYTGGEHDGTAVAHEAYRLFRNRPQHRFAGRIHEGVAHALPTDAQERSEVAAVRIEHFGYLQHTRDAKDKSRRNLELLERQAGEGSSSPFLSYNLGTEYASAGDLERAAEHFARGLEQLGGEEGAPRAAFGPSIVVRLVHVLHAIGRDADAQATAERGLAVFPAFTDLVLEQAQLARDAGDLERAEALYERCLEMGDAPGRFTPIVGAGTFLAATALATVRHERGDAAGAEELLLRTLGEHPRYLGSVLPLGDVMLARGAAPHEVVEAVRERTGALTPSVRFVLATALYEAGHPAQAEEQLRALLADDPSPAARLALAEALLSQRRWDEAADAAARIADGAPHAAPSAVTEAFARIVAGDAEGTARALERAERAGTLSAHRELLGAWARLAAGGPPPAALPLASGALALTVLEALLRVEEVDAFVALLPVLERVDGLSRRGRREALAGLYLRRGLLDSAAEEWVAAVQEDGPDANAFRGLSRIAAARGADEDAQALADEAHALAAA